MVCIFWPVFYILYYNGFWVSDGDVDQHHVSPSKTLYVHVFELRTRLIRPFRLTCWLTLFIFNLWLFESMNIKYLSIWIIPRRMGLWFLYPKSILLK